MSGFPEQGVQGVRAMTCGMGAGTRRTVAAHGPRRTGGGNIAGTHAVVRRPPGRARGSGPVRPPSRRGNGAVRARPSTAAPWARALQGVLPIGKGHDPFVYVRDVLERLATLPPSRIGELLPHAWRRC